MHMILTHMTAHNRYIKGLTALANQIPGPQCHLTSQNMVPIFRNPHEVVLNIIDRMWPSTVSMALSSPPMSDHTINYKMLKLFALKAKGLILANGKK